MPDALDRLKAALADRYLIERELGAGGMVTVYLAQDFKHGRRVAVKAIQTGHLRCLNMWRRCATSIVTALSGSAR